jgi:hypothetical protein
MVSTYGGFRSLVLRGTTNRKPTTTSPLGSSVSTGTPETRPVRMTWFWVDWSPSLDAGVLVADGPGVVMALLDSRDGLLSLAPGATRPGTTRPVDNPLSVEAGDNRRPRNGALRIRRRHGLQFPDRYSGKYVGPEPAVDPAPTEDLLSDC